MERLLLVPVVRDLKDATLIAVFVPARAKYSKGLNKSKDMLVGLVSAILIVTIVMAIYFVFFHKDNY
jgi:hypothetical protein